MKYYNIYAYQGVGYFDEVFASGLIWRNYGDELANYKINNGVISEDESLSGYMSLGVPFDHANIDLIQLGTIIEVCETDIYPEDNNIGNSVWVGRIIKIDIDEFGNKDCMVEGPYTFLKDCIIAKGGLYAGDHGSNLSIGVFLQTIFDRRNASQFNSTALNDSDKFINACLPLGVSLGSIPEYVYTRTIEDAIFSDIFKQATNGAQIWYVGETDTAFNILSKILDIIYDQHNTAEINDPYSYSYSYSIYSREDRSNPLKPVAQTVSINVNEINNSASTFNGPGNKYRFLSLNDCVKSCKVSTSFDSLYTCFMITGGDKEALTWGSKPGIPETYLPTVGLLKSVTTNGIVNGLRDVLAKHGIHTTILKGSDITAGDTQTEQVLNQLVEPVLNKMAVEIYDVDIVTGDISQVDPWSEPIDVGQYYQIIAPGLRSCIGYDPWLRCTSKKIDLMNPSKNEFSFTSSHRLSLGSTYSTTSRLTKLEEENKTLKLEIKRLKTKQDSFVKDMQGDD